MRYLCEGTGSPTIIIETGLGGQSVESVFAAPDPSGWAIVVPEVSRETRVCVYDRAGVGISDSVSMERTSADIVSDLERLLENAGISPPYVLVGHSFGGMNSLVFADHHPNAVEGMVLIDATPPDLWNRWQQALPPPSTDERPELASLRSPPDLSQSPEWVDLTAVADEVRTVESLGDLPLKVLTTREDYDDPNFPDDLERLLRPVQFQLQRQFLDLSSNAEFFIAPSAGHNIHVDDPQLVVSVILAVLREAQ